MESNRNASYFLLRFYEQVRAFRVLLDSFSNWYDFLPFRLGVNDMVTLHRNGRGHLRSISISRDSGLIRIRFSNSTISFRFANQREMDNILRNVYQTFIEEQYGMLNARGKEVVDVGANDGDSSMYFAVRGAAKVYAYEPYPHMFSIARGNIGLNKMEGIVRMLNEGMDGTDRYVRLDKNYQSINNSMIRESRKGKRIRMSSLDSVVKRHRLRHAALKMDCEGGEYGIILNASMEALGSFDQVIMEYHFGHERLSKKLRESGFKVSHTGPEVRRNSETNGLKMECGMIYAHR